MARVVEVQKCKEAFIAAFRRRLKKFAFSGTHFLFSRFVIFPIIKLRVVNYLGSKIKYFSLSDR